MSQPGTAKSSKFLLSTATVMLGPLADLHKLNPTEHAIGLVKNVNFTADPAYIELGQGVTNNIVMSVRNQEGVKVSMEVYEFTLRNLAYGAGLDASGVTFDTSSVVWPVSAASTATTIKAGSDITTLLSAGDYIYIQTATSDVVHIAKVATVAFASSTTTVTLATGFEIPTGVSYGVGDRFAKVKMVPIGGQTAQPELSCKIVGLLPKDSQPFTILIPRLKITKGVGVSFMSDNFANMPFEFTPYAGIPGDPFFAEYGEATAILFPR